MSLTQPERILNYLLTMMYEYRFERSENEGTDLYSYYYQGYGMYLRFRLSVCRMEEDHDEDLAVSQL